MSQHSITCDTGKIRDDLEKKGIINPTNNDIVSWCQGKISFRDQVRDTVKYIVEDDSDGTLTDLMDMVKWLDAEGLQKCLDNMIDEKWYPKSDFKI